jgi:hypothetical protein
VKRLVSRIRSLKQELPARRLRVAYLLATQETLSDAVAHRVISANSTSQTSFGLIQWIFSLTFGGLSKGDLSIERGFIR